jgi:hypothetical protein
MIRCPGVSASAVLANLRMYARTSMGILLMVGSVFCRRARTICARGRSAASFRTSPWRDKFSDTHQSAKPNVTNVDRLGLLTEYGPRQRFASLSRRGSRTYFADPVSSRARPLSNFAMSASSSDEVLTLDKRAGDVMGKIQLGA